jgi:hypothetical protein
MPYNLVLLQADEDHVRRSSDELGERDFGPRTVPTRVPFDIQYDGFSARTPTAVDPC